MPDELERIMGGFEADILEIVGDEFAPKQENGSPERKRLLGLLFETLKVKQDAEAQLNALFLKQALEIIKNEVKWESDKPMANALIKAFQAKYAKGDDK